MGRVGRGWGLRGESSTHDVGALGLEGVGPADVQVGCVVGLQEADEVETFRLGRERGSLKVMRTWDMLTQGPLPLSGTKGEGGGGGQLQAWPTELWEGGSGLLAVS